MSCRSSAAQVMAPGDALFIAGSAIKLRIHQTIPPCTGQRRTLLFVHHAVIERQTSIDGLHEAYRKTAQRPSAKHCRSALLFLMGIPVCYLIIRFLTVKSILSERI